ncbi:GGDEF domain-containing protein [Xinfangfangia sp. CPCC 101601]|uniref:GGDEF domain-containing protein n=1 Tax=Pseudogemmobacter lacusdianii TaxID=3069608 RepID=A0ABU0VVA6_9RHOB|nr:GGDEF domain-containing protein [Xinfangfangia sp. CPCC 101601]MDQ2065675.1 GGDEF domain-containing protein [Xinfangfangia sp. CPCC 101601]
MPNGSAHPVAAKVNRQPQATPVALAPLPHSAPDLASALYTSSLAGALSVLNRLAPMHLVLDAEGRVIAHGPTIARLIGGGSIIGQPFLSLFDFRGSARIGGVQDFPAVAGQKLRLIAHRDPQAFRLRGVLLPVSASTVAVPGGATRPPLAVGHWIVNLSFGFDLLRAVSSLHLTDADFAPTDLAMELLYLAEANEAVTGELRALAQRLDRARRQAREEAETDPLTGLRNRRANDAVLARLCREGEAFALLHIDLDYFKAVNDRFGHAAGDHVLAQVAQVMRAACRAGDSLARVGGDEFVLVQPGGTIGPNVEALAQRLIARLSRPIHWQGEVCQISASIGFVLVGQGAKAEPIRVLAEADHALYAAKKAGRGRVQEARMPPHAA